MACIFHRKIFCVLDLLTCTRTLNLTSYSLAGFWHLLQQKQMSNWYVIELKGHAFYFVLTLTPYRNPHPLLAIYYVLAGLLFINFTDVRKIEPNVLFALIWVKPRKLKLSLELFRNRIRDSKQNYSRDKSRENISQSESVCFDVMQLLGTRNKSSYRINIWRTSSLSLEHCKKL